MAFEYAKHIDKVMQALQTAHDLGIAKIRGGMIEKENEFFRMHIKDQRVIVAGSGLGHDAFELARYNKDVIGIDFIKPFVDYANEAKRDLGMWNTEFICGDFVKMKTHKILIDSVVLNMGTMGNFEETSSLISGLSKHAPTIYMDLYLNDYESMITRKKMYEEEGFQNVRIERNKILSDDGLYSCCPSKFELSRIVEQGYIFNQKYHVQYYPLCDFAVMAKISKAEEPKPF